eukprot:Amastigsp_a12670_12.p3 type:complete len:135 gc:universal Amastigsp_a12670_12:597-1001(+)
MSASTTRSPSFCSRLRVSRWRWSLLTLLRSPLLAPSMLGTFLWSGIETAMPQALRAPAPFLAPCQGSLSRRSEQALRALQSPRARRRSSTRSGSICEAASPGAAPGTATPPLVPISFTCRAAPRGRRPQAALRS